MENTFNIGDIVTPANPDLWDYGNITKGKLYKVVALDEDGDPEIIDDEGKQHAFLSSDWLLSSSNEAGSQSIAEMYVGQSVIHNKKKFKVTGWGCATSALSHGMPKLVTDMVKKFGYCYFVTGGRNIVPTSMITMVDNRIKLNDEYTAIVGEKIVKVGCQDIPIEKVLEIVKTHKEIYG